MDADAAKKIRDLERALADANRRIDQLIARPELQANKRPTVLGRSTEQITKATLAGTEITPGSGACQVFRLDGNGVTYDTGQNVTALNFAESHWGGEAGGWWFWLSFFKDTKETGVIGHWVVAEVLTATQVFGLAVGAVTGSDFDIDNVEPSNGLTPPLSSGELSIDNEFSHDYDDNASVYAVWHGHDGVFRNIQGDCPA